MSHRVRGILGRSILAGAVAGALLASAISVAAADSYTVKTSSASGVGTFLVGEDGKTLYTLSKDSANTSTCTGSCATAWPPFTLDSGETAVLASGIGGSLGTFKRPDGSMQVAYNGTPLYYFSGDKSAGQTNGQGIGGVWFVAGAQASAGGSGGATQPPTSTAGAVPVPDRSPAPWALVGLAAVAGLFVTLARFGARRAKDR